MGAALSLDLNDVLRDRNPRLFRTLAQWFGQSAGSIRLPVDGLTMTAGIRFPPQPGSGALEAGMGLELLDPQDALARLQPIANRLATLVV